MHLPARLVRTVLLSLIASVGGFGASLHAEVVNIDNDTLRELVESGVPVVDVRRRDEWESTGVLDGSELLTFFDAKGKYDTETWLAELGKVASPSDPVILICRSGNRTNLISRWLSDEVGHETVYNVTDGIRSWQAGGGATVRP